MCIVLDNERGEEGIAIYFYESIYAIWVIAPMLEN